jgi:sec-independent protein translocase protein TatB
MFGQFGMGEMLLLVIVGLFVFGPERLPSIARDAARMFKQFRDQARSMRDDLQAELGPELADLDLESLNPKTMVEKHLLGDDDGPPAARPARAVPYSGNGVPSATSLNTPAPSLVKPAHSLDKPAPSLDNSATLLNEPAPPEASPDETPYDGDAT